MSGFAEGLVVISAALPGIVLVWAGCRKLQRPLPASVAMVRFGLVRRVRPNAGRAAGAFEVLAGGALLLRPLEAWAYILPLGLLVLFAFLIARSLRRRERFSCACFGSDEGQVISLTTLLRTGVLLAFCAAGFVGASRVDSPLAAVDNLAVVALTSLAVATLHLALTIRDTTPFAD